MCGIAGIVAFTDKGKSYLDRILPATEALAKRGPDHQGILKEPSLALGHRRLSIIDTSAAAHQPMSAGDNSCSIVFNGEFFNFKQHRNDLISTGHSFRTESDTEVLLEICRREGGSGLHKVNGFFAFAFYDRNANKLLIARDRMGVKPLYYYLDKDTLIFGSELKALLAAGIPRELNHQALSDYLHLNYIPGDQSILSGVKKLPPGHFVELNLNQKSPSFSPVRFYKVPDTYRSHATEVLNYNQARSSLFSALDGAVQRRLISDVPLGTFLSGGIDSSVITGLAARTTPGLRTFSIGFRDEPHFDETRFAELVAKKHRTDHTVFSLTSDDLYNNLFACLDYLDEPFADSSALAVNILSMHTRKHVTVALSGDGADELFGGYNKHKAEWILRNKKLLKALLSPLSGLLSGFQGSRNSFLSNRLRQLHRFSEGASLSSSERYWRWCGFTSPGQLDKLLVSPLSQKSEALHRNALLEPLGNGSDLNDVLYMDTHMVLPDDMLVKVDRMSMAHALEVRSPFMDKEVTDIAFAMPSAFKIDSKDQKKILKDTFRDLLPDELLQRRKQGFEIPLLNWLRSGLDPVIRELLLDEDRIREQKLFHPAELRSLYNRLHSSQPGDSTARMWGLLVFQYWWDKYFRDKN